MPDHYLGESMPSSSHVAYFSMEVGIEASMPTYSGGLGILAGDTIRAAADLGVPMVGVTLLYRKGYFRQRLDKEGNQSESPNEWHPEEFLEPLNTRVSLNLRGREVAIRAWRYRVRGVWGHEVPVLFLDTDLEDNEGPDRALTDYLYGGDSSYRLSQEVVLGLGGMAMLRALAYRDVASYHMNEGHSALLALALLRERLTERGAASVTEVDIDAVRQRCVFTTHTPVPAGHDQFPLEMVREVVGPELTDILLSGQCCLDHTLNMTYLALRFSRYINGVSRRHEEISQGMFPSYSINAITNGVHALTWTSPPFRRLYDRHFPQWRRDSLYLRYAISIPLSDIVLAHQEAKNDLVSEVSRRTGLGFEPEAFTIGFARRATAYKRADLLFSDEARLRSLARRVGPVQVVFGGKAHPHDEGGKEMIRRIFRASGQLQDALRVVYLEDYDMESARTICAGVDLWLNTPHKPREASGTSGMKAAMNGVPSLSVLDGWWIEGHVEGVTGWSVGDSWEEESVPNAEADSLYEKLESVILPLYYERPGEYAEIMRWAVAINGSFFNAQRMMVQYVKNAYATVEGGAEVPILSSSP